MGEGFDIGFRIAALPDSSLRGHKRRDGMLHSVRSGLGIAVVPDFIVEEDLANQTIVPILTDWQPRAVALHLVTPPGTIRPHRVTALIDYLVAQLGR